MNYQSCSANAPGKIILFGEHAAVYGRPAIAIPVTQVKAIAEISPSFGNEIRILAPDIHIDSTLHELPANHPLAALLNLIQNTYKINDFEAFTIRVHSTIPVAAGLGSSAAVSVAITRAISQFFGLALDNPQISNLVYEIEKIQHGSPSGIDNSVITYQQPILFQRDLPILPINLTQPFTFLVGDTGIPSKTSASVGKVRKAREMELDRYNQYFDEIAAITVKAKNILEGSGTITQLGELLNQNHGILQKIGVSCHALDTLVTTAIDSGAYGAKLCGGGDGGNMIALVSEKTIEKVRAALIVAGAVRVITTNIEPTGQAHG